MLSSKKREVILHMEFIGDVKHDLSIRKDCPITAEPRQEMVKHFINTHHDKVNEPVIGASVKVE